MAWFLPLKTRLMTNCHSYGMTGMYAIHWMNCGSYGTVVGWIVTIVGCTVTIVGMNCNHCGDGL